MASRQRKVCAILATIAVATIGTVAACQSFTPAPEDSPDASQISPSDAGTQADAGRPQGAITLAAVAPGSANATGGAQVTISGTGFAAGASVTFAGAKATVLGATPTSIQVTLPPSPGPLGFVAVVVTNSDGSTASSAKLFRYFSTQAAFTPAPALAAISDGNGDAGLLLVTADLRGTSTRDLLASLGGSASIVSVLLGNKNGTFALAQTFGAGGPANALAVEDINGDSRSDLIYTAGNRATIGSMVSQPDGGLLPTSWAPTPFGAGTLHGIATGKISAKGPDIAINADDGILVYRGVGDGTFGIPTYTMDDINGTASAYQAIALADMGGDGILDAVITTQAPIASINVMRGQSDGAGHGDGSFAAPVGFTVGAPPIGLAVRDVTGDGHLDAITTDGTSLYVFPGDTKGLIGPATLYASGLSAQLVAFVAADLNGDGTVDVAMASSTGQLSLLLNDGLGTFSQGPVYQLSGFFDGGAPVPTLALVADDFNGDGRTDLAVGGGPSGASPAVVGVLLAK